MTSINYNCNEQELFKNAKNWKYYWTNILLPYIQGDVLEVGAGIGSNVPFLYNNKCKSWVCLEPDPKHVETLKLKIINNEIPIECKIIHGVLKDIELGNKYDTILYIDVLEHIKEDKDEILNAIKFLNKSGILIILSPAYNWLYSPFDNHVGHFRRYNIKNLKSIKPPQLTEIFYVYLDTMGLFASVTNLLMLRKKLPNKNQIKIWDKFLIPLSAILDKIILYKIGRSVVAIWQN